VNAPKLFVIPIVVISIVVIPIVVITNIPQKDRRGKLPPPAP